MPDKADIADDITTRRKRLKYRAWHRGTREMDLILGHFGDTHFDLFGTTELDRIEKLMDENDTDLLAWITGQTPLPDGTDRILLDKLRDFHLARARSS